MPKTLPSCLQVFAIGKTPLLNSTAVNYQQTHKLAVSVLAKLPSITGNVGQQLSSGYAQACAVNQRCLTIIAQNIRFLAHQGIALRVNGQGSLTATFCSYSVFEVLTILL